VRGGPFDEDGVVAVADIFAFLNAWFGGDPRADINGGGLSVSDIFDSSPSGSPVPASAGESPCSRWPPCGVQCGKDRRPREVPGGLCVMLGSTQGTQDRWPSPLGSVSFFMMKVVEAAVEVVADSAALLGAPAQGFACRAMATLRPRLQYLFIMKKKRSRAD